MTVEPRRGLLIDFGGVLTTNLFDSFGAFCADAGLADDAVRQHFREPGRGQDLLVEMECGRLPIGDFEVQFADVLGVSPAGLVQRLFAGLEPNEPLYAAVEAAHAAGIRTGLISNSWGTEGYDLERFARIFDALVISGELGMRKPAPEIYAIGAERLGLPPEQCVMVDDLGGNLKPAAAMGMATVKHVHTPDTVSTLEELLGVRLSASCRSS